jgi:hypothetical protein
VGLESPDHDVCDASVEVDPAELVEAELGADLVAALPVRPE